MFFFKLIQCFKGSPANKLDLKRLKGAFILFKMCHSVHKRDEWG